jgi:hypothetical protein
LRALDDLHLGEVFLQPGADLRAVGIDDDLLDGGCGQQGGDDMLVKRLAPQRAVILAGHTL